MAAATLAQLGRTLFIGNAARNNGSEARPRPPASLLREGWSSGLKVTRISETLRNHGIRTVHSECDEKGYSQISQATEKHGTTTESHTKYTQDFLVYVSAACLRDSEGPLKRNNWVMEALKWSWGHRMGDRIGPGIALVLCLPCIFC